MTINRFACAITTAFTITVGGLSINLLNAIIQPLPAAAQTACGSIRPVKFQARAASGGVNVRSSPSTSASILRRTGSNETLDFDAWTYGETVPDLWTNQSDARWYKIRGQNAWVASAVVAGNAPGSTPTCLGNNTYSESRINTALNKWNGAYAITDPNGYYPGQCVSFVKRFTKELGITMGAMGGTGSYAGGARFGFINYNQPGLSLSAAQADKINFTGREQPQVGDIIFFEATAANGWGHIAVVQSVLGNGRVVIQESNANNKAPNTHVTRGEINLNQNPPKAGYGRVMGWLRLKL